MTVRMVKKVFVEKVSCRKVAKGNTKEKMD